MCSTSRLESAAARATLYPFLPVYGTFLCPSKGIWLPVFGFFNVCTASGDQNNFCRTEQSNTRQYRAWLFGPVHPSLQKQSKQKEKGKKERKKWFKLACRHQNDSALTFTVTSAAADWLTVESHRTVSTDHVSSDE